MRPHRIRSQEGFTLIELVVVILIVGVLAAIALPAFLGQRDKGHDASAQSDARSMVTAMESCYTEVDLYDPCPETNSGLAIGTGPGEVEATPSGDTYVVIAHSRTGNSFTATKNLDATVTRTCSDAGSTRGGCLGGAW